MKCWMIHFLLAVSSFPLLAGNPPVNLGSGEPGLHIIYSTTSDHYATNQYVVYLDEPWTVGGGLIGGSDKRKIQVIVDHNFGLKAMIQSRSWGGDVSQLYAFDDQTAFTCDGGMWNSDYKTWNYWPRKTQVFATNADGIGVSDDVYALAHARYGLTTNQIFLGKIGTNIFYWETRDPRTVYYHAAENARATNCFTLPRRVMDIYGVTKAVNANKDVGFYTFGKSSGWFSYSPYTHAFIEVSFKNAKRVEGNK